METYFSDDLVNLGAECDAAIDSEDLQNLNSLIDRIDQMSLDDIGLDEICYLDYMSGNLYASASSVSKENLSAWRETEFPRYRVEAINAYRRARILACILESPLLSNINTNLTNEISHQGRITEAISSWEIDKGDQGDAPVVTAFSKARSLMWLTHFIDDPGHVDCYLIEAYKLLKDLDNNICQSDHPVIYYRLKNDPEFRKFLKFGDNTFLESLDWAKVDVDQSYSVEEKRYRWWCLMLGLFVNDLNDLTTDWIADTDILQFPSHKVKIGEGQYLSSAFSAIKREYCFARFLAYQGINGIHPAYENENLFLADTYDGVNFGGDIEKVKTALRVSFGILDSLAGLLNQYFNCQSKSFQFSTRWIKEYLSTYENPFVDALYWLACDLTDTSSIPDDKWKAPNPEGGEIRRLRNSIEHGWLRVVEYESELEEDKNDYAHVVSSEKLKHLTMDVLRFTRAAMLYVCFAVKYEEDRRSRNSDNDLFAKQTVPLWAPF